MIPEIEKRMPPYSYCVGQGEFRFIADSTTFVGIVERADWENTWLRPTLIYEQIGNGDSKPRIEYEIPVPVNNIYVRGIVPMSEGFMKRVVKNSERKNKRVPRKNK